MSQCRGRLLSMLWEKVGYRARCGGERALAPLAAYTLGGSGVSVGCPFSLLLSRFMIRLMPSRARSVFPGSLLAP